MDEVVNKIVALGIPGIVLLIVIAVVGPTGGAAIVVALATLGGPMGMLGGIGVLVTIALISNAISQYGITSILKNVIQKMNADGISMQQIKTKIESYPITRGMKLKLYYHLENV